MRVLNVHGRDLPRGRGRLRAVGATQDLRRVREVRTENRQLLGQTWGGTTEVP